MYIQIQLRKQYKIDTYKKKEKDPQHFRNGKQFFSILK